MKKKNSDLGLACECFKAMLDESDKERIERYFDELTPTLEYIGEYADTLPSEIVDSFYLRFEEFLDEINEIRKQIEKYQGRS